MRSLRGPGCRRDSTADLYHQRLDSADHRPGTEPRGDGLRRKIAMRQARKEARRVVRKEPGDGLAHHSREVVRLDPVPHVEQQRAAGAKHPTCLREHACKHRVVAIEAVAHKLARACCHMLHEGTPFAPARTFG